MLPHLLQMLVHLGDKFLLRDPGSAGLKEVGIDPQARAVNHLEVDHSEFHEPLGLRLGNLGHGGMKRDDPDEFFRRHVPSLKDLDPLR